MCVCVCVYIACWPSLIKEVKGKLYLSNNRGGHEDQTLCLLRILSVMILSFLYLRIHGIVVSDEAKSFYLQINKTLSDLNITDTKAEDIIDIIDGYKGRGYGLSQDKELGMRIIDM